jgi:hypothetical protein
MDIQAEKLDLIQAIIDIEDVSLIIQIQQLLYRHSMADDWFDELTIEQQQSIDMGLAQLDRGEGIPHEEAMKRLKLT